MELREPAHLRGLLRGVAVRVTIRGGGAVMAIESASGEVGLGAFERRSTPLRSPREILTRESFAHEFGLYEVGPLVMLLGLSIARASADDLLPMCP